MDEVSPPNVYAFAFYIFQQLNRWPEDGATDYGRAIFRVSPYLTPRYRADLIAELEQKSRQGELAYRVRGVQEIPGHGYGERRVDLLNEDVVGFYVSVQDPFFVSMAHTRASPEKNFDAIP